MLSLLTGGFLIVSMLTAWSGSARADSFRLVTTPAAAKTDTKCQLLPSSPAPGSLVLITGYLSSNA